METITLNDKDEIVYWYEKEFASLERRKVKAIQEQDFARASVYRDVQRFLKRCIKRREK